MRVNKLISRFAIEGVFCYIAWREDLEAKEALIVMIEEAKDHGKQTESHLRLKNNRDHMLTKFVQALRCAELHAMMRGCEVMWVFAKDLPEIVEDAIKKAGYSPCATIIYDNKPYNKILKDL